MSSSKGELTAEQLSEIGRAVHAGESVFSSSIPSGQRMLQQLAPPPKPKEEPVVEPPAEDPKLVEARAEERKAKEELAAMGDRLKYLESGARLLARKRGVDWDGLDASGSSLSKAASAEVEKRVAARAKHIATQRALAGKRVLSDSELEGRAREALAKEARSR